MIYIWQIKACTLLFKFFLKKKKLFFWTSYFCGNYEIFSELFDKYKDWSNDAVKLSFASHKLQLKI